MTQAVATAEELARAIKRNCYRCTGGQGEEIRQCPISDCPLFPYRLETRAAHKKGKKKKQDRKRAITDMERKRKK